MSGAQNSPRPNLRADPAPGAVGGGSMPGGGMPGGFDPSKMDPQMMLQFTQALQRLPKGQRTQRLQGIMQKGDERQGRDSGVRDDFERTLPPDIQKLMISFATQMQGMGGMPGGAGASSDLASLPAPAAAAEDMNAEQARQIVAAAAAEGKISKEEAEKLLAASSTGTEEEKKTGFSKFWRGITGKTP